MATSSSEFGWVCRPKALQKPLWAGFLKWGCIQLSFHKLLPDESSHQGPDLMSVRITTMTMTITSNLNLFWSFTKYCYLYYVIWFLQKPYYDGKKVIILTLTLQTRKARSTSLEVTCLTQRHQRERASNSILPAFSFSYTALQEHLCVGFRFKI